MRDDIVVCQNIFMKYQSADGETEAIKDISFELKSATMNKVEGTITLIDANCTVPMKGRVCFNKDNTFTLRYYELSED